MVIPTVQSASQINWDYINIPMTYPLLNALQAITQGKVVLDIGCGPNENHFIDFQSSFVFRYDVQGFYGFPSLATLNEFFDVLKYANGKAIIVANRSLSVMPLPELCELADMIYQHKKFVEKLIVCDYAIDVDEDYDHQTFYGLGEVKSQTPEWSSQPFYHFTTEQLSSIFKLNSHTHQSVMLPGKKRNLPGVFLVGTYGDEQ